MSPSSAAISASARPQPLVCAIVLNWNGGKDTYMAIDSLLRADYPNLRVIVVDNGSDSREVEEIERLYGNRTKVISLETNRGFAGGNNVGIVEAMRFGADYVFLLNNDAVVEPSTLSDLVQCLESDASIGVCGPIVLKYWHDNLIESRGGAIIPPLAYSFLLGSGQRDVAADAHLFGVDFVSGCAMMVRAKAAKVTGLLDEGYFMYAEDKDWCCRMQKSGWKTVVCRRARVRHMGGRSTSRSLARMEEAAHRSRARFFLTSYQGWVRLSIVFWLTAWTTVTFVQHSLTRKPELAVACAKGFVRGLTSSMIREHDSLSAIARIKCE